MQSENRGESLPHIGPTWSGYERKYRRKLRRSYGAGKTSVLDLAPREGDETAAGGSMGFENHAFISYAHLDNETLSEAQKGWITSQCTGEETQRLII